MGDLPNGSIQSQPEADLAYYSRPENYDNSLQRLQRFYVLQKKHSKILAKPKQKKKTRKERDDLFRRYRHILGSGESSTEEEEELEKVDDESSSNVRTDDNDKDGVHGSVSSAVVTVGQMLQSSGHWTSQTCSLINQKVETGKTSTLTNSATSKEIIAEDGTTLNSSTSMAFSTSGRGRRDDESVVSDPETSATWSDKQGPKTKKEWSHDYVKSRFAGLSAEEKSLQIRRKFSQGIKAVLCIRKLAAVMIEKSEEPSTMLKTFTDVIDYAADFNENLKNQGLSFDPSYFKANKEISISNEVKNILSLPPSSRTQEQIQTAMYGLQSLPSFAEYPLHMQEKLAKVAWYEIVPPKRTIIRQGHYAENFYFILSGQAVVTILIRDPTTNKSHVRTANFMRKGTSFGELALLHHSRRTATVTSQDTVQLLSIGREDFFDIFMSRQGADQVPEHIKFISQLEFMKGWPLERLLEHPEHCLLHFFKPNMVIVKDSQQSDWLYIVKSVLKQLHGVTAKLGIRRHQAATDDGFHLPQTGTSVRGPKVNTRLSRARAKTNHPCTDLSSVRDEEVSRQYQSPEKLTRLGGAQNQPRTLMVLPSKSLPSDSSLSSPGAGTVQPPVFVQVSRLKPRDVFGLELVSFHDSLEILQPSVSLVSCGAECIILSKDFFRRHANESVKKNVQSLVRPYPDEVTFQESLQRKVDWDLFKHTLIQDITSVPVQ